MLAVSPMIPFLISSAMPPQYARAYADHSTALQASLLAHYNTNVPPITSARSEKSIAVSDAGTDIKVQVRVFKVEEIAAANGRMTLKVWLRSKWRDERLAWNESAWGGISMITLSTLQPQQIWIPDATLYNSLASISDTLESTQATVYSDGSIFWSRPGTISVMCKFSGLVAFPYDSLKCSLEIGGWGWSGSHMGLEFYESGGAVFSTQEATAGSSYTEYSIREITSERVVYEYECCPSEPWPMLLYTISLHRASDYYVHLLLWPYVALTLVSFLVFFMSHEVGERLGFGITLILAIEVSKSVFAGMVPVCGEILWLELFSMLNLSFCILALAETCVVLFLAHHEDPHLLPPWIVGLLWACVPSACKSGRHNEAPLSSKLSSNALQDLAKADLHDLANAHTSLASQIARNMGLVDDTPTSTKSSSPPAGEGRGDVSSDDTNDDACERLSLFERYFFRLDTAAMGGVSLATSYAWLTFTCTHASSDAICDALMQSNTDGDGVLVLSEFIHVCCDLLWEVPLSRLEVLHETYEEVSATQQRANLMRWRRAARWVDRQARLYVPTSYLTLLLFLASVDLRDGYQRASDNSSRVASTGAMASEMFTGVHSLSMSAAQAMVTLIVPLTLLILLAGSWLMVRAARAQRLLKPRVITAADVAKRTEEGLTRCSRPRTLYPVPCIIRCPRPCTLYPVPCITGCSRTCTLHHQVLTSRPPLE